MTSKTLCKLSQRLLPKMVMRLSWLTQTLRVKSLYCQDVHVQNFITRSGKHREEMSHKCVQWSHGGAIRIMRTIDID